MRAAADERPQIPAAGACRLSALTLSAFKKARVSTGRT